MISQDLRYGWRSLTRSPGFTLVAIATLAVGIGANTTIFSLMNAVLLRPLAAHDPERVVRIVATTGTGAAGASSRRFSFRDFADYRERTTTIEDLSGVNLATFLLEAGQPHRSTAWRDRVRPLPLAPRRARRPRPDAGRERRCACSAAGGGDQRRLVAAAVRRPARTRPHRPAESHAATPSSASPRRRSSAASSARRSTSGFRSAIPGRCSANAGIPIERSARWR